MGLRQSKQKNIVLRVKPQITQSEFYKEAYFATNSRYKVASKNSLFGDEVVRKIVAKSDFLEVPLFNAKGVQVQDLMQENLNENDFGVKSANVRKERQFSDLPKGVILKAMNILHKDYGFADLARHFGVESRGEFIDKYLGLHTKTPPTTNFG